MKPLIRPALLMGIALTSLCAQSAETQKTTIMPMGDSITEGGAFKVYRYPLIKKLTDAGYSVEFVGSKTTRSEANSPYGELHHEGYGGMNVQFLAGKIGELYTQNPADIILLHAGHNQFADKEPIPGMLKATEKIIKTARGINPKVTILLGQVIPSGKLPKYSYIPEYNEALVKLATELNTPESRIILVNHAEGFNWETDTGGDHVHPTASGAEKMAQKWFDALKQILPPPHSAASNSTP